MGYFENLKKKLGQDAQTSPSEDDLSDIDPQSAIAARGWPVVGQSVLDSEPVQNVITGEGLKKSLQNPEGLAMMTLGVGNPVQKTLGEALAPVTKVGKRLGARILGKPYKSESIQDLVGKGKEALVHPETGEVIREFENGMEKGIPSVENVETPSSQVTESPEELAQYVENHKKRNPPIEIPDSGNWKDKLPNLKIEPNKVDQIKWDNFRKEQGIDKPVSLMGDKTISDLYNKFEKLEEPKELFKGLKDKVSTKVNKEPIKFLDRQEALEQGIEIPEQHTPSIELNDKDVANNYRLNDLNDINYAIKDGKVVGHLGVDDEGAVKAVFVDPEMRRQGIAEQMYKDYFDKIGHLSSDEISAMEPEAKALWKKLQKQYSNQILIDPKTKQYRFNKGK